jgi:hypothetical protein
MNDMEIDLGCVVEGHGEMEALPILIRRIAEAVDPTIALRVHHPIRISRSKLLRPGELERATRLAALNAGGGGAVLIVLDSDDDCPATLAAELLARARHTVGHLPISVVLPKREFEAWFLAAAESLRGVRGLSEELAGPPDPEAVRGAKEWLSDRMVTGRKYRETLDQAALTARFDMAAARRADSFDKLCREVRRLIAVAGQTNL